MKPGGRKKLNIFLVVLLVLAAAVLALLCHARSSAEAVSPGNYIRTEAQDTAVLSSKVTVELFRSSPSRQFPFSVDNMLPGDSAEKTYTINVSHKDSVDLYFSVSLQDDTDAVLAQGLCISITRSGETLYDGTFAALPPAMAYTLPAAGADACEEVPYSIRVYLPTSAGNEYQNKHLTAEFRWWASDSGAGGTPGGNGLTPWVVTPDGRLDIPKTLAVIAQTGGSFWIRLLFMLLLVALTAAIMYFLLRRKEDRHERK